MKEVFIIIGIGISAAVSGQTFDEWFHQKKTQISYLHQQIAALEVYEKTLAKGYEVTREGTNVITSIKHGDFSMHTDHFSSLGRVNPVVRRMALGDESDDQKKQNGQDPYLAGLLTDGWYNMSDDERYDAIMAAKKREAL